MQHMNVEAKLIGRSLMPSSISIIVSLFIGILIILGHIVLLGLSGEAFPTTIDDVLLQGYANYIVGPLARAINHSIFNVALLALVWGTAGLLIYEFILYIVNFFQNLHNEKESITLTSRGEIRHHPLEASFLRQVAWRLCILVITLLYTTAILPVIGYFLENDLKLLKTSSPAQAAVIVLVNLLLVVGITHGYIVLLRWYVRRTRVTGEIEY